MSHGRQGRWPQGIQKFLAFLGQMDPPGPTISWIGTAFDQISLLQPIDHSPERDRFDLDHFRERSLVAAWITTKQAQHLPLRTGHAHAPSALVEVAAKQA